MVSKAQCNAALLFLTLLPYTYDAILLFLIQRDATLLRLIPSLIPVYAEYIRRPHLALG